MVQAEQSEAAAEFSAIYGAEASYVCHCLRRLGVPPRDLEDKAQDVFVVVYRKLADYDRSRPLRPWLTGIAVRVALDHLRKAYQKHEDLKDTIEAPATDRDPEQRVADREAQQIVLATLDRLELDQRTVLVLHDIEGHKMPEIAEMVAAPLNTLYSRLRLARQAFTKISRRLVAQKGVAGGGRR